MPLVHVHGIRDGAVVMNDDNVKVTAALVDHADQMWIRAAQSRFGGRVILGKDLLEI